MATPGPGRQATAADRVPTGRGGGTKVRARLEWLKRSVGGLPLPGRLDLVVVVTRREPAAEVAGLPSEFPAEPAEAARGALRAVPDQGFRDLGVDPHPIKSRPGGTEALGRDRRHSHRTGTVCGGPTAQRRDGTAVRQVARGLIIDPARLATDQNRIRKQPAATPGRPMGAQDGPQRPSVMASPVRTGSV